MRPDPRFARLTACLVAAGLLAAPPTAWAQPAYQPSQPLTPQLPAASPAPPAGALSPAASAPPAAAASAEVSPPLRVGRVARLQGTVSFHAGDATQWVPATLNYPVSSQDAFWTQPGATAEIEVSDSRMALNAATELDLTTLDTTQVAATVASGEVFAELREIAPGESWTLQTPRGTVTLGGDGRYGIASGDTEHPTLVTVLAGVATVMVSGSGAGLQAGPGQAIAIDGTDRFTGRVVAAQPDAFVQAMAARDAARKPTGVSLPPMVARMPGSTELAEYGSWQSGSADGTVWYPHVPSGWVPYRDGHWAYVAPWGWTWVDAAPWGFAPFHYGRWAEINGAWAWVPGRYQAGVELVPQPVYAPALVTFVGPEGDVLAGAAIAGFAAGALAGGAIGWLPLGPREPYYPWFHARPEWVRDVNVGHVADPAVVMAGYTHGQYGLAPGSLVNRGAGTLVPAAALLGSRPIAGLGHPLPAADLGRFQPVFGHEPLRPGAATAGLTPSVAARLGVAGGPPRLAAPGPALAPPSPRAPGPAAGAVPLAVAGRPPALALPEHAGPPLSGVAARPGIGPAPGEPGHRELEEHRGPTVGAPAAAAPAFAHPTAPAPVAARPVEPQLARPTAPAVAHPEPPRPEAVRPAAPAVAHPAERAPAFARPAEPRAPAVSRPAEPVRPIEPPHGPRPPAPQGSVGAARHFAARPAAPHVEAAVPRAAPPPHFAAAVPRAAPPAPRAAPPGGGRPPHHPG